MMKRSEKNPWLSIPASDYETHMGESGARQLSMLSEVFKNLLDEFSPESVAVLGCATGNGFEHIRAEITRLLVGVDINPKYLEVARQRHCENIPGMQLFCSDIKNIELAPRSFDLVSCGLFFEHTDPELVVAKAFRWLKPGGVLGTVLQLANDSGNTVTDTGVDSIRSLESVTRLVSPDQLTQYAEKAGFRLLSKERLDLDTGKSFNTLVYRMKS